MSPFKKGDVAECVIHDAFLTKGKRYRVLAAGELTNMIRICNDGGDPAWCSADRFKLAPASDFTRGDVVECIGRWPGTFEGLTAGNAYKVVDANVDKKTVCVRSGSGAVAWYSARLFRLDERPRYVWHTGHWLCVEEPFEGRPLTDWTPTRAKRSAFTRERAHAWAKATGGAVRVGRKL